jgi:hypothetical protein
MVDNASAEERPSTTEVCMNIEQFKQWNILLMDKLESSLIFTNLLIVSLNSV